MNSPLADAFDAVVMLTWSDWHGEPRSNRYHYATRFARELPVFFVQNDGRDGGLTAEPVAGLNIQIVHAPAVYDFAHARELQRVLRERGCRRPLLWIYNWFFEDFILLSPSTFRIYHATEDYLSPSSNVAAFTAGDRLALKRVLRECDMVVAVSDGVAASCRDNGGYSGRLITLRNGCDNAFWKDTHAYDFRSAGVADNVALFQGGINRRLDYDLLLALTKVMPDWQFWFCGRSNEAPAGWDAVKRQSNVRDFGFVGSEEIAALARHARVGIIPFTKQDEWRGSLPLKAYEYLACGLPVVSTPIEELEKSPELFCIASTANDFAAAIRALGPTRDDPKSVAGRLAAAESASYDRRYPELTAAVVQSVERKSRHRVRGNVLILYDDRSTHVATIREHLEAFTAHSRHCIYFLPATHFVEGIDDAGKPLDLSPFDAVMIHYSVRLSLDAHISPGMVEALTEYDGTKILFIQDEYDTTETARRWISRLGVDVVFTNVPPDGLDEIYPRARFPNIEFLPTLTGYVPEGVSYDEFALPLAERPILIGYRGRRLPHQYGDLGHEKYRIGIDVRRLAQERGLLVDIEVDSNHRIYGDGWYRFLGSCRAMLGTEGGCNVFDFDGALSKLATEHEAMPYEEFKARFLAGREGPVRMNQVSPKIFEAIGLRTALVLFEGDYSGVVEPHKHFIPLKKDYTNIDEVFALVADDAYVSAMTERAYREVFASGRFSYAQFVAGVDECVDRCIRGRRRVSMASMPAMISYGKQGTFLPAATLHAGLRLVSSTVLHPDFTREELINLTLRTGSEGEASSSIALGTRRLMRLGTRIGLAGFIQSQIGKARAGKGGAHISVARWMWRRLPIRIRSKIIALIG